MTRILKHYNTFGSVAAFYVHHFAYILIFANMLLWATYSQVANILLRAAVSSNICLSAAYSDKTGRLLMSNYCQDIDIRSNLLLIVAYLPNPLLSAGYLIESAERWMFTEYAAANSILASVESATGCHESTAGVYKVA